jgi:pimeloyl-ACP methyl ester carboxylesterase
MSAAAGQDDGQAHRLSWEYGGRSITISYETLGQGTPVLLLPAFSTVSTRDEMRPLAALLGARGFGCTLLDWPGFGESMRGRRDYAPALYRACLAAFVSTVRPTPVSVVAAGHAAGYALGYGHERPQNWRRIVLLAPTWRGPLPTAMGPHPRACGAARTLVRAPVLGEAVYRLNTLRRVVSAMYRRHVYSDPTRLTDDFVAEKQRIAGAPGARFASVAFVTGALDPLPDRASFLRLLSPPPAPTLVLCGEATPPKSRAEMAAIPAGEGVDVRWVPGSLGLAEEQAAAISDEVATFLAA